MKALKKYLGIIWMAIGPLTIYYLVKMALSEIAAKPVMDTKIQWGVFVLIFIPIAIGMVLFGYYVLTGEYEE